MLIAILIKHKVLFMLYKSRQVIVLGSGTVKKIIGGSYHSIPRCEFHFFFFFSFFGVFLFYTWAFLNPCIHMRGHPS